MVKPFCFAEDDMFKYLFDSLPGIEIFAIGSLFFFMAFFIVIIYRVIRMNKGYLKKAAQLPFDSTNNQGDHYNG